MKYLNKINLPADVKKLSASKLNKLAEEIRSFLIHTLSETGGHLASNLGVVELTLALHYCFDSPHDKIIWDVGHQAYTHKLLTGRMKQFGTIRQLDGLSGFPKSRESEHDAFDTGHSSTSISAALGYCMARDLAGERHKIVAVIGDGSMTGGLAYEALNNAGRANTDLLVVLNDNQMSISKNVGALSRHLNDIRTAPSYLDTKENVNLFLNKLPVIGKRVGRMIEKAKDSVRYLLVPGVMFEELGFTYVGPIDGHNIEDLIRVFGQAQKMTGPVLLHVYTKKGKGYAHAENSPEMFHGVDSFNIDSGRPVTTKIWDTYSDVFGNALVKLAEKNEKIVAVTAAMPDGTGLSRFGQLFPDRLFDVGIAEGHAVTFAAGLAKGGYIPVFAVYSSFLQRSYDQILHDVCNQNLHVIFAVDRAGIVGSDGETHQGIYDLSFLSHMPNMTIMAPKNKKELAGMLSFAAAHNGPVAIRYPRGAASRVIKYEEPPIELGKMEVVHEGSGFGIVSVGAMMDTAYEVFTRLRADGLDPGLINARFIKPVVGLEKLNTYKVVFVLEDNVRTGGYGSLLLEKIAAENMTMPVFKSFSFPDRFIEQGTRSELFQRYQLDPDSVYVKMKEVLAFAENSRNTQH